MSTHRAFIFYCLILISLNLNSQPINNLLGDVAMPTPDVAAISKFTEIDVNLSTGVPSIGVPIHTISEGPLSVPIAINYHASGNKVSEAASWVGFGWALSAGGLVTRTVLGNPDEYNNGFWHTPFGSYQDPSTIGVGQHVHGDLNHQIVNGWIDGEPDMFSFNIPGYSGKFYIDREENGNSYFLNQPKIIPKQDLKIVLDIDNGQDENLRIRGFRIIDPFGNRYWFGEKDGKTAIDYSRYNGINYETASAWHLLKIENFDGSFYIDFTYDQFKQQHHSIGSNTFSHFENDIGTVRPRHTSIPSTFITVRSNSNRIKTIKTIHEEVIFEANTIRLDMSQDNSGDLALASKSLDKITIEGGPLCKEFDFSYSYFKSQDIPTVPWERRLRLEGVTEKSCDGEFVLPYAFSYVGNFFPRLTNRAIDHWGYYNGQEQNNELQNMNIPLTILTYSGVTMRRGGADRESYGESMKLGMLEKITYPTGAYTKYTYEANTCWDPYEAINKEVGGLRIKKIEKHDGLSETNNIIRTYEYFSENHPNRSSGLLFSQPEYSRTHSFPMCTPSDVPCIATGIGSKVYVMEFFDNTIVPLTSYEGYHLYYTDVQEYYNGNGSIKYSFKTPNQPPQAPIFSYPRPPVQLSLSAGKMKSSTTLKEGIEDESELTIVTMNYEHDFSYEQGDNFYIRVKPYQFTTAIDLEGQQPIAGTWYDYSVYSIWSGAAQLTKEISTLDGKTVTKEYKYDALNSLAITSKSIESGSSTRIIEYKYANEGEVYDPFMLSKNMIHIPLKETRKNGDEITGGYQKVYENGYPKFYYNILLGGNIDSPAKGTISGHTNGLPDGYTARGYPVLDYTWDDKGRLDFQTFNSDWVWDFSYYGDTDFLHEKTDIDGQKVVYQYDQLGRLELVSERDGQVTTEYEYNISGTDNSITTTTKFADETDPQIRKQRFDGLGRLLKTIHNGIIKEEFIYDKFNRVKQQTHLVGNLKTNEYEPSPLNRIVKQILPDGNTILTEHIKNSASYKVKTTNEKGNTSLVSQNAFGNVEYTEDAYGNETIFNYDSRDNVKLAITPEFSFYRYTYDDKNRMTSKVVPGWETPQILGYYEDTDLLKYSIDPNGFRWDYEYDPYGREWKVYLNSTPIIGATIDEPTTHGSKGTVVIEHTYGEGEHDLIYTGKLKSTEAQILGEGLSGSTLMEYTYDSYGRVETLTETLPFSVDVSTNTYNLADWLKNENRVHTYSDGNTQALLTNTTSTYDLFGRERTRNIVVSRDLFHTTEANLVMGYNNRDQLEFKHLGNLETLDYGYDPDRGWLININDPLPFEDRVTPVACPDIQWRNVIPDDLVQQKDPYKDIMTVEELLATRFDIQWTLIDEDNPPCTTTACQTTSIPCDPSDINSDLSTLLINMQQQYGKLIEVPCADNTFEEVFQIDWKQFLLPIKLHRVRLCDESERYVLADFLNEIPNEYLVIQTIVINDINQTFTIDDGSSQDSYTIEELLDMIFKEVDIVVGDYTPCPQFDCNFVTPCSFGEIALQQAILQTLQENNPDHTNYPTQLHEVELCNGQLIYLLPEELALLDGTSLTTGRIIDLTTPEQVVSLDQDPLAQGNNLNPTGESYNLFYMYFTHEANGNIKKMNWQVRGRPISQYGFGYDDLDRLINAHYCEFFDAVVQHDNGTAHQVTTKVTTDNRYGVDNITYDKDGNLLTLTRRGITGFCSNGIPQIGEIDHLEYKYEAPIKNQLTTVSDATSAAEGFNPGSVSNGLYAYDKAGNLKADPYKGLSIEYNTLNLPKKINGADGTLEWAYDATGRKLQKRITEGSATTIRRYVGGIEYNDGKIKEFHHSDGRFLFQNEDIKKIDVEYAIRDHLGNTRLMITAPEEINPQNYNNQSLASLGIIQENHYYPFGLNQEGNWVKPITSQNGEEVTDEDRVNAYQYNGKELDTDLGLDWNDYGARYYDAAIGRFTGVDPLADASHLVPWSPYHYTYNNPILYVDPDGMAPVPNEYEVRENEDGTTTTTLVGTEGGNETDYITYIDACGEVTCNEEISVEVEYSEGVGTDYTQDTDPTPGERQIHGKTPTIFVGLLALFTGGSSGTVSKTLGFASKKGVGRVPTGEAWKNLITGVWQKGQTFFSKKLDKIGGYRKIGGNRTPSTNVGLPKKLKTSRGKEFNPKSPAGMRGRSSAHPQLPPAEVTGPSPNLLNAAKKILKKKKK